MRSFLEVEYLCSNFLKIAAKHTVDHGMFDTIIQKLGCWTSNALKLYFTISTELQKKSNLSVEKGMP